MKKTLCQYCNNSNKVGDGKYDYVCCGGKKEAIEKYESDARAFKKAVKVKLMTATKEIV
jgi:23S rRNA A1618 N6-methylase RlmF